MKTLKNVKPMKHESIRVFFIKNEKKKRKKERKKERKKASISTHPETTKELFFFSPPVLIHFF